MASRSNNLLMLPFCNVVPPESARLLGIRSSIYTSLGVAIMHDSSTLQIQDTRPETKMNTDNIALRLRLNSYNISEYE